MYHQRTFRLLKECTALEDPPVTSEWKMKKNNP